MTGSTNWAYNRKLSFTGSLSRDFSTTATGATTETTSGTLDATWAQNARLSFSAGVGGGINQFYGPYGLLPGTDKERTDYYFTWHVGANYTFNSHLSAGLIYSYFQNWSNLPFAAFDRNSYTLTLSVPLVAPHESSCSAACSRPPRSPLGVRPDGGCRGGIARRAGPGRVRGPGAQ